MLTCALIMRWGDVGVERGAAVVEQPNDSQVVLGGDARDDEIRRSTDGLFRDRGYSTLSGNYADHVGPIIFAYNWFDTILIKINMQPPAAGGAASLATPALASRPAPGNPPHRFPSLLCSGGRAVRPVLQALGAHAGLASLARRRVRLRLRALRRVRFPYRQFLRLHTLFDTNLFSLPAGTVPDDVEEADPRTSRIMDRPRRNGNWLLPTRAHYPSPLLCRRSSARSSAPCTTCCTLGTT